MRYVLASLLCLATLAGAAGCSVFSQQKPGNAVEEFSLGRMPDPQNNAPSAKIPGILMVSSASVPSWLQGSDLYYRLAYAEKQNLQAYSHSRWAAPAAELLTQRLRNYLASASPFQGVLSPEDGAKADYALRISLEDFSQQYLGPQNSIGMLRARLTLVDLRDFKVIAQKNFVAQAPAPSPNAAGGVAALDRASILFIQEVDQWLNILAPQLASRAKSAISRP